MKRTCEKLAVQLARETQKALADIRRQPDVDSDALAQAALHLRAAIAELTQARGKLEAKEPATPW